MQLRGQHPDDYTKRKLSSRQHNKEGEKQQQENAQLKDRSGCSNRMKNEI